MNTQLQNDLEQFESILNTAKNQALHFLNTLANRPTSVQHSITDTAILNDVGLGTADALKQFNKRFEPVIVASSGPRYWGFVTGGATPAAIVGDWLAAVYDQNTQTTKGQGDISAVIELETIQLLLQLLNLPHSFLGGFVTGATMSNFTCIAVARQWIGKLAGKDFAKEGVSGKIPVLTATAHSSSIKSLSMLGIGSNAIINIKTAADNREAIDTADLQLRIKGLNGQPFILITSAGTVNSADFDDFEYISLLKNKYHFWWHIDAAFGGFASCSPKYKHLLNGWEKADSITIDCHKWLNVPYESAFYLVKENHKLLQVETFQNSNAPYLGDPLENFNYLNFLPENSRRLKALPAWLSLIAYGKKGYQDIVENSVELAQHFGGFIAASHDFELLAPVRLNTVCFTLKDKNRQEKVPAFLNQLNSSGKVFMTPTTYKGKKGIRAAFVNWRTNGNDVAIVIELMQNLALSWV